MVNEQVKLHRFRWPKVRLSFEDLRLLPSRWNNWKIHLWPPPPSPPPYFHAWPAAWRSIHSCTDCTQYLWCKEKGRGEYRTGHRFQTFVVCLVGYEESLLNVVTKTLHINGKCTIVTVFSLIKPPTELQWQIKIFWVLVDYSSCPLTLFSQLGRVGYICSIVIYSIFCMHDRNCMTEQSPHVHFVHQLQCGVTPRHQRVLNYL
jgi:hypothetical protein